MRTNYVLIDYESVQPDSLAPLAQDHFRLMVFVGASQARVPFELAAALQSFGERATYIKISGNGPNALDFHIAYWIGRLSASDATAYFHIVSKDTGFDPLITHLKTQQVLCGRVKSIDEIPLVKASTAKSPSERVQVALSWLSQTKASKPRTVKTLGSSIASLFQKQLSAEDIDVLIKLLVTQGHVAIIGTKVSYPAVATP
jgi:PIN domain